MKVNKKAFALVAAGALVAALGLFGCGGQQAAKPAESSAPAETSAAAAAAPAETSAAPEATETSAPVAASDTIQLIKPGTLTVFTSADYPPFENLEGDEFVGLDIDLIKAIGGKLGLEVAIENQNFDSIITAVAGGKSCDVGISGFSVDPERAQTIDFSDPYYTDDQAVAVMKGGNITAENAAQELNKEGVRIAVQSGTTGETYVEEHFPNAEAVPYTNSTDCFAYLQSDKVDAACTNLAVVNKMIAGTYSDAEIVITEATGEDYAIVISKNNPALTAAINKALAELKADGTIDELLQKWL